MHINLDYTYSLAQRLNWAHEQNLQCYNPRELELITDYILHADKASPKVESKYVNPKETPKGLKLESNGVPQVSHFTKPKPIIHYEDEYIKQYTDSIDWLTQLETQVQPQEAWKVRRWKIEHRLDMGIANSILHPTIPHAKTFEKIHSIDIEPWIDLSNSFHVSKLVEFYSQLKESTESQLFMQWFDDAILAHTPLYPWQEHLLKQRIEGVRQITIGRELGELYGKIVTPSTMSQALRTIYRQIAITAEKELFAHHNRDNPAAWRTCRRCGEKKMIEYDFYPSKPNTCKVCASGKTTIKGNMKYATTKEGKK